MTVTTFHGLGLRILRELHARAGLPADFRVADEAAVLGGALPERPGRRPRAGSYCGRRSRGSPERAGGWPASWPGAAWSTSTG